MATRPSLIAKEWDQLCGKLILVSGGGSFGHPVVRQNTQPSALTCSMYDLKALWVAELQKQGVPAFPIQIVAPEHAKYVLKIAERGYLPILTCDYILGGNDDQLISSDEVPALISSWISRVMIFTNVCGVLSHPDKRIIPKVNINQLDDIIRENIYKGPILDVTGGMAGKLYSLKKAVQKGASGFILNGSRTPSSIYQFLHSKSEWSIKTHTELVRI